MYFCKLGTRSKVIFIFNIHDRMAITKQCTTLIYLDSDITSLVAASILWGQCILCQTFMHTNTFTRKVTTMLAFICSLCEYFNIFCFCRIKRNYSETFTGVFFQPKKNTWCHIIDFLTYNFVPGSNEWWRMQWVQLIWESDQWSDVGCFMLILPFRMISNWLNYH